MKINIIIGFFLLSCNFFTAKDALKNNSWLDIPPEKKEILEVLKFVAKEVQIENYSASEENINNVKNKYSGFIYILKECAQQLPHTATNKTYTCEKPINNLEAYDKEMMQTMLSHLKDISIIGFLNTGKNAFIKAHNTLIKDVTKDEIKTIIYILKYEACKAQNIFNSFLFIGNYDNILQKQIKNFTDLFYKLIEPTVTTINKKSSSKIFSHTTSFGPWIYPQEIIMKEHEKSVNFLFKQQINEKEIHFYILNNKHLYYFNKKINELLDQHKSNIDECKLDIISLYAFFYSYLLSSSDKKTGEKAATIIQGLNGTMKIIQSTSNYGFLNTLNISQT